MTHLGQNMSLHHIQLISESVDYGESIRDVCPECESPERTLSVTRTDEGLVLYQCFRASCTLKGCLGVSTRIPLDSIPPSPVRKIWDGDTRELPQEVRDWVQHRWGISDPPHWYYTDDYGGRIAMSIRSPKGVHRGWVLRNDGSSTPKALTYVEEGEDALSWYKTVPDAATILVEDIPSAARASMYVNAVALCGTGIGKDRAREIAEYATRPVIVALDQDATDLSFKWAKKYSLLWDTAKVLPLKQDIKDMQENEVWDLLQSFSPLSESVTTN